MNTTPLQSKPSFTILGSLAAIVLQLMLAPSIAIFEVTPNFILCFVVVNAMLSGEIRATVTGFILGLAYDFVAHGALGAMTLVLTLLAYGVSSINKEAISISWTVQAFFLLVSSFIGEVLYAAELSIIGDDTDFLMSLGMRVLPTALYSGLIGLIVFLIMSRINEKKKPELLRSKFK